MQLVFGLPSRWEDRVGLAVRPLGWDVPAGPRTIRTALHQDGGFQHHIGGVMVRAATPEDVFREFGFDWTEIILNWPDQNRMIFWSEVVQAHLDRPILRRLVIPADGHNAEVVERCLHAGLRLKSETDFLELEKP